MIPLPIGITSSADKGNEPAGNLVTPKANAALQAARSSVLPSPSTPTAVASTGVVTLRDRLRLSVSCATIL